jgi:diguanylate cyclase (GGDEF)-like protein/PAS domain S-box-containing protein
VLSADGTVIYHPDHELIRSRHNLGLELGAPALAGGPARRVIDYRGRAMLDYRVTLPPPLNWQVHYAVPYRQLLASTLTNGLIQMALLGLAFLALFLALGWSINRRLTQPAERIAAALERFDLHGDREVVDPAHAAGTRELERIVGAANSMAAATRAATEQLEAREAMFRTVTENSVNLALWLRPDGGVHYITPSCERITGYSQNDFYEDPQLLSRLIHPEDRERWAAHAHPLTETGEPRPLDVRLAARDGQILWLRHFCKPIVSPTGELLGHRSSNFDVTRQKEAERQLVHNAYYDALTGLPNRSLLLDRLSHALGRARREPPLFALLFLDLDRFKVINDSLGHQVGDGLLVAVAEQLRVQCRPGDTVARLGGDEFAVLLEGVADSAEVMAIAGRIHARLARPFQLPPYEVFTTASIGVALSGQGYTGPEEMVRDADIAMYRAKAGGRERTALFDQEMRAAAVARLELENDLRRAVEQGTLQVYYQPIVRVTDGRLYGMEALARWQHPRQGPVGPGTFIPVAEETGLILPLGAQVLQAAVAQTSAWQRGFPRDPPLRVNVNLSGIQLAQGGLVEQVQELLRAFPLAPDSLSLELTESVLIEYAGSVRESLETLRGMGVRLAMDDFGSGYSSLGHLRNFPFHCLKIERSFIRGITTREEDRRIVRTIIDLAHHLGLDVVAEGIERPEQLAAVAELGCDYAQGFLFAPALAPAVFETRLQGAGVWQAA